MSPPVVLSVAGTDSGGAAGLAADLTTLAALGVHGAMVVAAVTAQDTTGVHAIHPVPTEIVEQQLDAVLDDLQPAVIKTGMLGSAEVAHLVVSRFLQQRERGHHSQLVVDPVLRATSGAALATEDVLEAYRRHLLPVATLVTPNAGEARALLGLDPTARSTPHDLAAALSTLGPVALVTGGPDGESAVTCTDWLAVPGEAPVAISHPAVTTANDHGTGCTHASALAARLAHGDDLATAAREAVAFVVRQLHASQSWDLGRGRGPVAHTHQGHTHQGHTHQGHTHQGHTHQGHTHQGHTHQGES